MVVVEGGLYVDDAEDVYADGAAGAPGLGLHDGDRVGEGAGAVAGAGAGAVALRGDAPLFAPGRDDVAVHVELALIVAALEVLAGDEGRALRGGDVADGLLRLRGLGGAFAVLEDSAAVAAAVA